MNEVTTAVAAREYLRKGFMPVPIPRGEKGPRIKDWPNFVASEELIDQAFTGNVGLLLGNPSNGLIDIDLDTPEALRLATFFLPPTDLVHGRQSKPRSHYWYQANTAAKTKQFKDSSGVCLLEVRSTGGQTVVPPSLHPSGETFAWDKSGAPAGVDYADLLLRAEMLAAATLCLRRCPQKGSRQDYYLALAGLLLKGGCTEADTEHLLRAIAVAANDEEIEARVATVQRTAERVRRGEPVTGYQVLEERFGAGNLKNLSEWLHLQPNVGPTSNPNACVALGQKESGRLRQLLDLAKEAELFHSPEGDAYVTVEEATGPETFAIQSSRFDRWMTVQAQTRYNYLPREQSLKEARYHFVASAIYASPCLPVFLRVAGNASAITLDLADAERRTVEITATGWKIRHRCTIKFIRPSGVLPLPCPLPLDDLTYFDNFFNVGSPDDLRLLLSWVLFTFNPIGPYPVLVLQGEAGSAKSTLASMLKRLVDPSAVPLRSLARNEQDFVIGAISNHVLAFDNLSGLKDWASDVICRLASGAGFATRRLFSDHDEVRFQMRRPVILNGIDDIATRHDLIDRAIVLNLPSVPAHLRQDEITLQTNFEAARPYLLGALLSRLAQGINRFPAIVLAKAPRMADFARWSAAAEETLGWSPGGFLSAYESNQADSIETGIESSLVAEGIEKLLGTAPRWSGTATELRTALDRFADESTKRSKTWPRTASQMGSEVRRLAPAFRAQNIEVTVTRDATPLRARRITFRRLSNTTAQTYLPLAAVQAVQAVLPTVPHSRMSSDVPGLDSDKSPLDGLDRLDRLHTLDADS